MKLLRMTATFGRLDHETLTLTDRPRKTPRNE